MSKNINDWEDVSIDDWQDVSSDQVSDDTGILPTMVNSLASGATAGFSDELVGGLSALMRPTGLTGAGGKIGDIGYDSPTLDLDVIKDEYFKSRDASRGLMERQADVNPTTSLVSNLVGGFATPAMGAAKAASLGANAWKSAALAGAGGNVMASIGEAKELEDIKAKDLGIDALIGGAFGTAVKGAGTLIGGAKKALEGSELSQKMSSIYNKSKSGVDLLSKESPELFNQQLMNTSNDIVDTVAGQANKFKSEYSKAVKELRIDVPEKFQADLDNLANELADQQVRGGMIDVRSVDATINKLRGNIDASDSKIQELKEAILKASKAKKEMSSAAGYKKSEKGLESVDTSIENLSQKRSLDDELFQIKEDLLLLREQKKLAKSRSEITEINDLLGQKVKDKFYKEKELKDLGYDISEAKLDSSKLLKNEMNVDKSSRDILTQVDPLQSEISTLKQGNMQDSDLIASLIEQKQATNNTAFSGLLNQMDILKNTANTASLGDIKDVNLNSLRSYAEQMGRPDLVSKIEGVIKSNIKGAPELDSKYRDMIAGLKELGVGLDSSASSIIKNQDAGTYLTQQLKQAAKNTSGDAANKLADSQQVINNPKIDELLSKGKDLAENYNLSKDINQASIKSIGYRGAALVGQAMDNKLTKAATKLGNSNLGQKVKDLIAMPEGDARNRAIFSLSQQPWFRSVSEDENNK